MTDTIRANTREELKEFSVRWGIEELQAFGMRCEQNDIPHVESASEEGLYAIQRALRTWALSEQAEQTTDSESVYYRAQGRDIAVTEDDGDRIGW